MDALPLPAAHRYASRIVHASSFTTRGSVSWFLVLVIALLVAVVAAVWVWMTTTLGAQQQHKHDDRTVRTHGTRSTMVPIDAFYYDDEEEEDDDLWSSVDNRRQQRRCEEPDPLARPHVALW